MGTIRSPLSRRLWKLRVVRDAEGGPERLAWGDPAAPCFASRPPEMRDLTAAALAALLDGDARDRNHHLFDGVHAWLAKTVAASAGERAAISVLLALLERGGLQGFPR